MAKIRAKLKSTNEVLQEHEVFFRLLIIIGNQRVRQSQLEQILLDTGYCKNPTALNRLLTDFKDRGLTKKEKPEFSKYHFIEATSKSVKFILGTDGKTKKVAKNTAIRDAKNAMRLELFIREYVEKQGLNLEQALEQVKTDGFNLFTDNQRFYDLLNEDNLAYLSFVKNYSTFFKQEDEMKYRHKYLQEHIEKTARTRVKGNKTGKFHRKIWVLDDLKRRNIFFKDLEIKPINREDWEDWMEMHYSDLNDFETLQLEMNFIYPIIDYRTDQHELFLNLARLHRFIRSSFYMHEAFFLKKMNTKRAIVKVKVNIDVVCINEICYKKIDQTKILAKLDKKISKARGYYKHFKFDFNVDFSHLNINKNNEHISV